MVSTLWRTTGRGLEVSDITGVTNEPDIKSMYGEPREHEEHEYDPKRIERMEAHERHMAELRRAQMWGERL